MHVFITILVGLAYSLIISGLNRGMLQAKAGREYGLALAFAVPALGLAVFQVYAVGHCFLGLFR